MYKLLFQPCELHQSGGRTRKILGVGGVGLGGIDNQQRVLGQTWSKIKTAASTLKEKVPELDLEFEKETVENLSPCASSFCTFPCCH